MVGRPIIRAVNKIGDIEVKVGVIQIMIEIVPLETEMILISIFSIFFCLLYTQIFKFIFQDLHVDVSLLFYVTRKKQNKNQTKSVIVRLHIILLITSLSFIHLLYPHGPNIILIVRM